MDGHWKLSMLNIWFCGLHTWSQASLKCKWNVFYYWIWKSSKNQEDRRLPFQVRGQVLSRDKFSLSADITFMSHRWLRYTMTAKQVNVAIDVFLVWLPVKYCDMLHNFFCIRRVYYKTLIPWKPMSYCILNIKWRHNHYQTSRHVFDRLMWWKIK